jgi:23S rRNA A1618 N6-methylase RlmF
MCNPPFYSSYEEVVSLANNKEFAPHAVSSLSPIYLSSSCRSLELRLEKGQPLLPGEFTQADCRCIFCSIRQICTGAETEMITEGGEVGFVKRMVEESVQLRSRCRSISYKDVAVVLRLN